MPAIVHHVGRGIGELRDERTGAVLLRGPLKTVREIALGLLTSDEERAFLALTSAEQAELMAREQEEADA